MRYLRKYNENSTFDIDFAIVKIREHFSEEEVASMVSKEISEWADDEDFYSSNGNGEAEEVVIQEMINWFKREFSKQIEESDFAVLEDEIKAVYQVLN
jgi:beta-lactamase class D